MKRFILICVALLVVTTGFAQVKKVDLDIKTLKELVGKADRVKMNELLVYQGELNGEEIFQGFSEYEQLQLAYRCVFKNEILQRITFGTPYTSGYNIDLLMTYKIDPYKKDKYDYRNYPMRFFYKWDDRQIIVDHQDKEVSIFMPYVR